MDGGLNPHPARPSPGRAQSQTETTNMETATQKTAYHRITLGPLVWHQGEEDFIHPQGWEEEVVSKEDLPHQLTRARDRAGNTQGWRLAIETMIDDEEDD